MVDQYAAFRDAYPSSRCRVVVDEKTYEIDVERRLVIGGSGRDGFTVPIDAVPHAIERRGARLLVWCIPDTRLFAPWAIAFETDGTECGRLARDPDFARESPTESQLTGVELDADGVPTAIGPNASKFVSLTPRKTRANVAVPSTVEHVHCTFDVQTGVPASASFAEGRENEPAFDPLVAFGIRNDADHPVRIADLRINEIGWWSVAAILDRFGDVDASDEERALTAWEAARRLVRRGTTYQFVRFEPDTVSVTRFLCGFGSGACGTFNRVLGLLAAHLGVPAQAGSLADGSHAVVRLAYDGADRYFDALYGADPAGAGRNGSYFRRHGGDVASYDELCADHNIVYRAGRLEVGQLAALFGNTDEWSSPWWDHYEDPGIEVELGPGETITFENGRARDMPLDEGLGISTLRLSLPYRSKTHCASCDAQTVAYRNDGGTVTFRAGVPFPITGIRCVGTLVAGRVDVAIGEVTLASIHEPGPFAMDLTAWTSDWSLPQPLHEIEFVLVGSSLALLEQVEIDLLFQVNRRALPAIRPGTNTVTFDARSAGERSLELHVDYLQAPTVTLPEKAIAEAPADGIETGIARFSWRADDTVEEWEFCLSEDRLCQHPYSPLFELFVRDEDLARDDVTRTLAFEDEVPLVPGERYHWRIRGRSFSGVWGEWSEVTAFRWNAPSVVSRPTADRGRPPVLTWSEPKGGTVAVAYEVYGSNVRGFVPSRHRREVWTARDDDPAVASVYPPNLITTVVEPYIDLSRLPGMTVPPVSYRIVALDANGARSEASEECVIAHPQIHTVARVVAAVGVPFGRHIESVRSLGALRFNRLPDLPRHTGYFDAQVLRYRLVSGPAWITVRDFDGYCFGMPGSNDRGVHNVAIEVRDQFGNTDTQTLEIQVP